MSAAELAAAGLSAAGYVPYLRMMARSQGGSSTAAWVVFSCQQTLLLASVLSAAPAVVGLAAAQSAGSLAVCGWSLHRSRAAGKVPLGPAEKATALVCLAALLVWPAVGPAAATWLLAGSEAGGMVLVLVNLWRNPGAEPASAWALWAGSGLATLLAAGSGAAIVAYAYAGFFALSGAVVALTCVVIAHREGPPCHHGQGTGVPPFALSAEDRVPRYLGAESLYIRKS